MSLRVMFVKERPYLYRQHNIRIGTKVRPLICQYLGPLAGGVPWGVQSRPRKPRAFGEERTPRVDIFDPNDRNSIKRQIEQGLAIAATQLEKERKRKTVHYEKQERRKRRLQREILSLRRLGQRLDLWRRL